MVVVLHNIILYNIEAHPILFKTASLPIMFNTHNFDRLQNSLGMAMLKTTAIPSSPDVHEGRSLNKNDGGKGLLTWLGSDLESSIFQWFTLSELLTSMAALSHHNRTATFNHFKRTSSLHFSEIRTNGEVKAFQMCQRLSSLVFVTGKPPLNTKRISIIQELFAACIMHNRATLQVTNCSFCLSSHIVLSMLFS
jgi:hypothetical protein